MLGLKLNHIIKKGHRDTDRDKDMSPDWYIKKREKNAINRNVIWSQENESISFLLGDL